MATSGTVGQTVFTTQQVLDHACRRGKLPAELIAGEKISIALQVLWLLFQQLSSQGVPVWRIQQQLWPLYQGQGRVPADVGTVEVLNANLRTMQRLTGTLTTSAGGDVDLAFDTDIQTACTQTVANGNIQVEYESPTTITTIGLLPNATGVWDFVYEISQDGATWVTVDTFTDQAVVTRQWLWRDYNITRWDSYSFARIRATDGTTLDVAEFFTANMPNSIPMAPLNKDDYFNLPNKVFQGRPVQFWQDMERDLPALLLWPIPNGAANFQLIEGQVHMQLQDVGTMAQALDIPARWFNAVIWSLARDLAYEEPEFKGDIKDLENKADRAMALAWGGITPKGPIYIQPNISPYTRG